MTWEERCAALADACMKGPTRRARPPSASRTCGERYDAPALIDLQERRTDAIRARDREGRRAPTRSRSSASVASPARDAGRIPPLGGGSREALGTRRSGGSPGDRAREARGSAALARRAPNPSAASSRSRVSRSRRSGSRRRRRSRRRSPRAFAKRAARAVARAVGRRAVREPARRPRGARARRRSPPSRRTGERRSARADEGRGKTVVMDYSSPNVAKPLAFHHLRSTMIGNSLVRALPRARLEASSAINHLGDWGTGFGKLLLALETCAATSRRSTRGDAEGAERALRARQRARSRRAKAGGTLEDRARAWFKRLEDGDAEARAAVAAVRRRSRWPSSRRSTRCSASRSTTSAGESLLRGQDARGRSTNCGEGPARGERGRARARDARRTTGCRRA